VPTEGRGGELPVVSVSQKCQCERYTVQNLTIPDSLYNKKSFENQLIISGSFLAQKMLYSVVPVYS
jgi:hypothetical protein